MDVVEICVMDIEKMWFVYDMVNDEYWMDNVIEVMGDNVFIIIDLDVFDFFIMLLIGILEFGGMFWYEIFEFLK